MLNFNNIILHVLGSKLKCVGKEMKTVIIHGQNHKGSSYNIGRALANKVETEDEITEFFLPKDLNHFCLVGKERTKIWMKKK